MTRRVFSFDKMLTANSFGSATVTASELGLASNEIIRLCSAHQAYRSTASSFIIGINMSYGLGGDNRSVTLSFYNTTSTDRTIRIQVECLVSVS